MNKYVLNLFADDEHKILIDVLGVIEEQEIQYVVKSLQGLKLNNLKILPFNLGIVIDKNTISVISNDKNIERMFSINTYKSIKVKNFIKDICRFIKKLPLKGEWSE